MTGEGGRGDAWRTGVLTFVLGAAVLLGYFGPLGYAALAALGGVLMLPVVGRGRPWTEWWVLLALTVWAGVTLTWSPARAELRFGDYDALEQITAAKLLLQLVVYGLLVAAAARASVTGARRALLAFSWGAAGWAGLILLDGLSGGRVWAGLASVVGQAPTLQFQEKKAAQGAYVLAVLIWPAIGMLRLKGWQGAALIAVAGLLLGSAGLSAYSATLAVIVGGLAYALISALGRNGGRLLGAAAAGTLLLLPLAVLGAERVGLFRIVRESLPQSWAVRTQIWSFTVDRAAERPFLGWGVDASRFFGERIPLHPHDAPLQLWLELGVVGALIGAVFWLLLFRRVGRLAEQRRATGAVAGATAAAYFTVGALSFGVWQEWWLAAAAFAVVLCILYAKLEAAEEAELEELGFERA